MEEDKIVRSVEDASKSLADASAEAAVHGRAADDVGDQNMVITIPGIPSCV